MTGIKSGDTCTYNGDEYKVIRIDMRIKGREVLLAGVDFPVSVSEVSKYVPPKPAAPIVEMSRQSTWDWFDRLEYSDWHKRVEDPLGYTQVISDAFTFYQQIGLTDPYTSEEFFHTDSKHSHKFVRNGVIRFPDKLYYPASVMKCLTLEEEAVFDDLLKKAENAGIDYFFDMIEYSRSVVEQRVIDYTYGCTDKEVVEANKWREQKWDDINKHDHDVIFAGNGASPIYRNGKYFYNSFKPSHLETWWAVKSGCKYKYKIGDAFSCTGDFTEMYTTRYVLVVTALGADRAGNPVYHTAEVEYFPKVSVAWGSVKANNCYTPDNITRHDNSGMFNSEKMSPRQRAEYILNECTPYRQPGHAGVSHHNPRDCFIKAFINSARTEDSLKKMHPVDITKDRLDKWAEESFSRECSEYDNANAFYGKVREWTSICSARYSECPTERARAAAYVNAQAPENPSEKAAYQQWQEKYGLDFKSRRTYK